MKRTVAALMVVALLVMTAGGVPPVPVRTECAEAARGCCAGDDHAKPAPKPAASLCEQCCLLCCAVVASAPEGVAAPGAAAVRWNLSHADGSARNEKPPLPPPRLG